MIDFYCICLYAVELSWSKLSMFDIFAIWRLKISTFVLIKVSLKKKK